MTSGIAWLITILGMTVAGILQIGVAPHLEVLGGRPDFLVAFALSLATRFRPAGSCLAGLLSGILWGAIAGANLTVYGVSRILSCLGVSIVRDPAREPNFLASLTYVAAGTLLSQALLVFLAPTRDLGHFLLTTVIVVAGNALIAIPCIAFLAGFDRRKASYSSRIR